MGLYISTKRITKAKTIFVLVATFALVVIPTFIGIRSSLNAHAESIPPQFINSPHYVHANTTDNNDTAAEIAFYPGTTRIEIIVDDGQTQTYGDSPTAPLAALPEGANKIDLRLRLAPGRHTISGVAVVDGQRVPIRGGNGEESGEAVVYALDTPTVSYETPTVNKQSFNSSVSPVRVKIDDEFEQLKSVTFSLYAGEPDETDSYALGDFVLDRTLCNTTTKDIAICDITSAANWKNLAEGTYFVKLKTSTKAEDDRHPDGVNDEAHWSLPFIIDNTAPAATINGPLSVIGGETIRVQGSTDKSASEATLYVDDAAMGPAVIAEDGSWTYDLKADLTLGDHKVKIIAKDSAGNTNEAAMTLTVNPFVPALAEVQKVNDAAVGLTTPFAVPQALSKEDIPPAPNSNTNTDTAVLGAQDVQDPKADQSKLIAAVAPSTEGWKLFGITWFWWIIMGLTVVVAGSWLLASKRQYATEKI
jgi:hypothetical protein